MELFFRAPALIVASFALALLCVAAILAGYCTIAFGLLLLAGLQARYLLALVVVVARHPGRGRGTTSPHSGARS